MSLTTDESSGNIEMILSGALAPTKDLAFTAVARK